MCPPSSRKEIRATRAANLDKNLERLSSGSRINHAGDDAAGLAISESLRAQIRGIGQAERNAQDGVSLVQVAESAMGEISNILIRLRELGGAGGFRHGRAARAAIPGRRIPAAARGNRPHRQQHEFNGVPLLNGTANTFEIQVGTGNNPVIDRIKLFDANSADVNVVALGLNLTTVADKSSAQNSLRRASTTRCSRSRRPARSSARFRTGCSR